MRKYHVASSTMAFKIPGILDPDFPICFPDVAAKKMINKKANESDVHTAR
jgi:hypothetical protein